MASSGWFRPFALEGFDANYINWHNASRKTQIVITSV